MQLEHPFAGNAEGGAIGMPTAIAEPQMRYAKRLLLHALFTLVCISVCRAAVLIEWKTFGNTGNETSEPSATNDPGVGSSTLLLGAGLSGDANGNRFGGDGWFNSGNTAGGNTLSEAVAGDSFIEFTVTPTAGFEVSLTSLLFSWQRSSTGPANLSLRSSADNYALTLGTVTGLPTTLSTGNNLAISGLASFTTATTFRLYGYGATAAAGTGGFDTASDVANVQLNGTAVAVPEPTVVSLLLVAVGVAGLRRRERRD